MSFMLVIHEAMHIYDRKKKEVQGEAGHWRKPEFKVYKKLKTEITWKP